MRLVVKEPFTLRRERVLFLLVRTRIQNGIISGYHRMHERRERPG